MKGLIIKDFINLKKNAKIFSVVTLLYIFMAYMQKDASFFSGIFTMVFAILTLSLYSYDDMAKWDSYALTMPVSKENIVQGKYLMMLLLTAIGTTISLLFTVILNIALKSDSAFTGISACAIGAAVVILFYSVTLPFITKLGVEKARFIFFAVYLVPFMIIILARRVLGGVNAKVPSILVKLMYVISSNMAIILPIVVIAGVAISYVVSIRIYRKKEF
ncbi:MAG: ABC-2 transporter permease [Mobilitalea sp.]